VGQGNGQQADWAERREGEEKKFSFSYLIFQIQFQMFLNLF
jgi:hypothetical protein